MESTLTSPAPTFFSSGIILPWRASTSPSMPRRRGTEKPQMSASRMPMVRPRRARATARLTVTDDLPTPPLPEAMASTRAVAGMAVSGASSRAFQRARAMTAARSAASMVAMRISIEVTQSSASTWPRTSCSIWERSGQAAMVRATSTDDPVAGDGDGPHHAQVDDVVAELGVDHGAQALAYLFLALGARESVATAKHSTCVQEIPIFAGPSGRPGVRTDRAGPHVDSIGSGHR